MQQSLTSLYSAIGIFVLTTFDIGIVATSSSHRFGYAAVILGLLGTAFLCYSSMLLIVEARRAFASTKMEMDFVWRGDQIYTSSNTVETSHRVGE